MNYKELKAGDVRQGGDEYRRDIGNGHIHCNGEWGYRRDREPHRISNPNWLDWVPARLHGHAILMADLILTQYRRPL